MVVFEYGIVSRDNINTPSVPTTVSPRLQSLTRLCTSFLPVFHVGGFPTLAAPRKDRSHFPCQCIYGCTVLAVTHTPLHRSMTRSSLIYSMAFIFHYMTAHFMPFVGASGLHS